MKFYDMRDGLIYNTAKSDFLFSYSFQCSGKSGSKWIEYRHIYITSNNRVFAVTENEFPKSWRWRRESKLHMDPDQSVSTTALYVLYHIKKCGKLEDVPKIAIKRLENMLKEA